MHLRWRVFPPLALGVTMATLDISVVNIALPTLSRTFGVPLTTVEWVVLAYVLTITGLLLTLGRIADAAGRRRVYGAGLVVFVAASALCAAAPGALTLAAARALQGVGAAMMTANSAALLVSHFPPGERGRALGAFGAVVGVGLAMGPPLGGLIVDHGSWRWLFLLNLPIGALAFVLLRRIPPDAPSATWPRIPVPASAAWFGALTALLLALSQGPARGWGDRLVLGLLAAAIGLGIAFFALERRVQDPLLPGDLGGAGFRATVALTLIGQALSMAVGIHMPLYLEEVLGLGPATTGQWLAILPLAALGLAPLAGRLSDRVGTRPFMAAGLALTACGMAALALLGTAPSATRVAIALTLVGVGLGLFVVTNTSALLGHVPPARLGAASGMQATMRNLGIAGGSAVATAVLASRFTAHGGGTLGAGMLPAGERAAFALASRDLYAALTFAAIGALALAIRFGGGQRRDAHATR